MYVVLVDEPAVVWYVCVCVCVCPSCKLILARSHMPQPVIVWEHRYYVYKYTPVNFSGTVLYYT